MKKVAIFVLVLVCLFQTASAATVDLLEQRKYYVPDRITHAPNEPVMVCIRVNQGGESKMFLGELLSSYDNRLVAEAFISEYIDGSPAAYCDISVYKFKNKKPNSIFNSGNYAVIKNEIDGNLLRFFGKGVLIENTFFIDVNL